MQQVRYIRSRIIIIWHLLQLFTNVNSLLYPQGTLAVISSVSVPVTEYFPERVFIVDWCFSMGFDLPGNLSTFYNIPVWPVSNITKRDLNAYDSNSFDMKYDNYLPKNRHHYDFSAGELYQAIEDHLISFGYDETCLLRVVCELAQHPFDDQHQNYLTEIITFILSPSLHEGFDETEEFYRNAYSNAEQRGLLGENCTNLYAECEHNLLGFLSNVISIND